MHIYVKICPWVAACVFSNANEEIEGSGANDHGGCGRRTAAQSSRKLVFPSPKKVRADCHREEGAAEQGNNLV